MPLQSHSTREAWPVLSGQFQPQGQEQHQVRSQGRPSCHSQATEELRNHEVARGSLGRTCNRTIQPADQTRSTLNRENLALSSKEFIYKNSKLASASRKSRVSKFAAVHFRRPSTWQVGLLMMSDLLQFRTTGYFALRASVSKISGSGSWKNAAWSERTASSASSSSIMKLMLISLAPWEIMRILMWRMAVKT